MDDILINKLSVYYDKVCALKDVDYNVSSKSFVAIIGPNGGGKSTLLKVIAGLKNYSNGDIIIGDNKRISYVPQHYKFDRSFPISVKNVVLQGCLEHHIKFLKRYTKENFNMLNKYAQILGIEKILERNIGELSGGQMQKVLIARALVSDVDILLLDEPLSNVDATSKMDICKLLNKLKKEKTILMITHDIEDCKNCCDEFVYIDKKIMFRGDYSNLPNNLEFNKNKKNFESWH